MKFNGEWQIEHYKRETKKWKLKMEVHHHPQVEKKNFKEYFLEFLMIFLAVTMGFFAETIREKISENEQAGDLAKSLYQEVYSDSVNVQKILSYRIKKENNLDYFRRSVKDSDLTKLSPNFYSSFVWGLFLTTPFNFEPNDAVLNQLRNSGSLRLFRRMDLQTKIGELGVIVTKVREREQQEYGFSSLYARPFVLKYFDFDWLDSVTALGKKSTIQALEQDGPKGFPPAKILNQAEFKKQEAENLADYYLIMLRSSRQSQFAQYVACNHELLELLRKQYDVEK
jgi:hypothetical protein